MAYDTRVDTGAQDSFLHPSDSTLTSSASGLGLLANIAGGVVSIALVVGIGVWGYKLMVRDVSGIPVVRAAEGDMRVRPEDPGGELAQHQGLAVNEIAAVGGAQAPADRLVLAPQPVVLTDEDVPMDENAVAIVQQALAARAEADAADGEIEVELTRVDEDESVDALVSRLTNGVQPLEAIETNGPEVVVQVAATPSDAISGAIASVLADVPGVKKSLRPQLRPARAQVVQAVARVETSAERPSVKDVDAASLPAGTRLAQLGAYDSVDVAKAEWTKFNARFGDLLAEKNRVIEQASSGGRKFYRLRAMGFEDLADARRFCSALVAEGADCIPVVTR